MRRLTHLLRRPIIGSDGRTLGRPSEVIADRSRTPPLVTGIVVHGKRMPWPELEGAVVGDLLLVRDVLDVQMLDGAGRHRGRVGDVELETDVDGALRVVAVQTGLRPVLERLRLGLLARRASSDRIPWEELHPLAGRAHAFTATIPERPHRFEGVMRARRRSPR